MAIEWRPAMSVDGGVIDDDHRYLISLINQFNDAIDNDADLDEVRRILGSLKYYTVYHFVREQAAQKAAEYPSRESHAQEHKSLVESVDSVMKLLDGYVPGQKFDEVKEEIARLLRAWLVDHIIKHDLLMRPYVRKMSTLTGGYPPITAISSRPQSSR